MHGESKTKLYKRWITMKQRCLNTEATGFNYYGGKGVIVCSEWLDNFETFKNWALSNDYQEGLEIDRTNPDGDYEPLNCRWVTKTENLRNIKRKLHRR